MPLNILIVDDSATVRAVIRKTLGLAEIPVGTLHQAGNGDEALQILHANTIDLVFSDINMPGMGGVELIEHMHADERLRGIPVVVISTEGSTTRIEDLRSKGIRAYLRKPFTPEQLKDVVEEITGGAHED
jgi:two-component system chemotaxis response regulator CheY